MKEKLIVANLPVDFMNLDAKLLKGITLEMRANFNFFQASIAGQEMILLRPKQEIQRYTPLACQKMQLLVEKGNGKPSAFWFNALDFNQRTRLVEKGVYFIVSGKYAFLPNMILNSRSTGKRATEISAPAQYVLLYHLQEACLEGRCAKDLAEVMPYKYNTLSLAMQVLEDLGLCSTILGSNQEKRLHFELRGDDLWQKSLPFLMSPVKKRFYCDTVRDLSRYPNGGISALTHYSRLNPDRIKTIVAVERAEEAKTNNFERINSWDGAIMVEIWKYPPIVSGNNNVDRLSLALSLKDDDDPRVHKEVELMIKELWLKD